MAPEILIPDAISPVVGYRVWVAATDAGQEPVLRSVFRDLEWPVAEPFAADCVVPLVPLKQQREHPDEGVPARSCTCGVYLLKSPDVDRWCSGQPESLRPGFIVGGVVSGWGKFLEASEGYRVQFARPVALLRRQIRPILRPGQQASRTASLRAEQNGESWIRWAAERYGIQTIDEWIAL
jgi:hypothetical protein